MQRGRTIAGVLACAALTVALTVPAAERDEAKVQALERECEQAREARIKPLRDAEIARCKAEKRNDPAYCERFWSDYGAATRRPNKTIQPRMFDDLPECVAAREARQELKNR
jgi:hypothetical protein